MSESATNQEEGKEITQAVENKMSLAQKLRVIFMTLLGILLITFIVQNSNRVEIEFLNINFRIRIIFIILISALIGALITFSMMKWRAVKKKRK